MQNWKMILSFPFLEESKRKEKRGRIATTRLLSDAKSIITREKLLLLNI